MARGISIHIGMNEVDPEHYSGWSGRLGACEKDATDMHDIASKQGFEATLLKTKSATRDSVKNAIQAAAAELQGGDFFLLSYSGHGGQVEDVNGDEDDGMDETWCLYDGQLIDDELAILWADFMPRVRVFVISDSCHSGTVTKAIPNSDSLMDMETGPLASTNKLDGLVFRFMPRERSLRTYRKNKTFYDEIQYQLPSRSPRIRATVRLMSGCQDDQLSYEGKNNGRFTEALRATWADAAFKGDYKQFHENIVADMPTNQNSNHLVIGTPNEGYDGQRPFTI
jgi:hypothetical protein